MRFLGIDPGLVGAACVFTPAASVASGQRWHLTELPTFGERGSAQRRIDSSALRDWIMKLSPEYAVIELVGSMPGQGIASAFKFGRAVGAIEGVVASCGVKIAWSPPVTWKKNVGLPTLPTIKGEKPHARKARMKEKSRMMAIKLFPELKPYLNRVMDHGMAEAALIAYYASIRQWDFPGIPTR